VSSGFRFAYERHRPEETVLYQLVQAHLGTLLARARERTESGQGYPGFVEKALREYLRCGILAHGFCRCVCQECGFERAVPFSCKTALCPSCHARRMSEVAAKLCDERLPPIPYRQWVMSFPRWVRIQLLRDKQLFAEATRVFIRRVFAWQRKQARALGIDGPLCGAIAIPQFFGGRMNANPHIHALFCDGVFTQGEDGALRFHRQFAPTAEELYALTIQIGKRVLGALSKARELDLPEDDDQALLSHDRAAATGWPSAPQAFAPTTPSPGLSAFVEGFSLHAGVLVEADDRAALERLIRYTARFPLAEDRLSVAPDGRVVVRLKRPWPTTGETELLFEPVEFLRKLVALLPPPRTHRVRYFGIFASHAKAHHAVRALVPRPEAATPEPASPEPASPCAHDPRSAAADDQEAPCAHDPRSAAADDQEAPRAPRPTRIAWAKLLRRVFQIDVETCPRCAGRMKIVAALTDPAEVRRYLSHVGLPTAAPEPMPARAPPQTEWTFAGP